MSTYFIFCDIDGDGRRWRLVVEREDNMLYFPEEDFEEHQEVFANYPSVEVEPPNDIELSIEPESGWKVFWIEDPNSTYPRLAFRCPDCAGSRSK